MTSDAPQSTDHHLASAIPSGDAVAMDESRSISRQSESTSIAGRIMSAIWNAPLETRFLWILLILFAAKGVLFTFIFPPFSGHDEVAHYAYLKVLVEDDHIPLVPDPEAFNAAYRANQNPTFDEIPDYFQRYQRYITKDWWHDPDTIYRAVTYKDLYLPAGWIYTANHPPLYYLLMAPVYSLTSDESPETQLYALRLAAIPLGMLTVLFAFLTVRRLFPGVRFLAVVVPTLVAFQPQIAYESAMLNNDILAIATTSACIYLIVVGLQNRFTVGLCAWLGLALGLAVLSKQTAVIVMPVIAVAMMSRLGWKKPLEWLPKGGLVIAITAALVAPWYAYMLETYGNFSALDRIKTLQHWNYSGVNPPSVLEQLTDPGFAWMRWRETWGEFGWRLIPLGDTLLQVLFWGFFAALVGIIIWTVVVIMFRRRLRGADFSRIRQLTLNTDPVISVASWQVIGVASMTLTCVLGYYAVLQFGTSFSLTQARYYFPAVNAAAIVIALGVRMLTPVRLQAMVQTTVFAGMFLLNVVILSSYVIPYWADGM